MRSQKSLRHRLTSLRLLAAMSALALGLSIATPASAATPFASTAKFIASKFVGGQYVEGLTAGKPDWGFSVEAMLQLKGAGYSNSSLSKAIAYNLTSATNLGTKSNPVGFLYAPDKSLLIGRTGEFLFACKVFSLTSTSLCKANLATAKSRVAVTGAIAGDESNAFNYAWFAMGLAANGATSQAAAVATKLASFARADGGFGTDLTADTATSAADATGIALQAFAATKSQGTSSQVMKRKNATAAALRWLARNTVTNHFEAWGEIDVNGTCYAVMGMHANGASTISYAKYLSSRINSDGGISTPWSTGGDTYASVQGYLALRSLSYLDLLK